jgi:hypothetical protein
VVEDLKTFKALESEVRIPTVPLMLMLMYWTALNKTMVYKVNLF